MTTNTRRVKVRRAQARKYKRKRYMKRKTTNVIRGPGPVAPKTIVALKSSYTIGLSDTVIDYRFRLNSIYDLDLTGTGHQPYGHDTYALLYNRYRVFRTKAVVTVTTAEGNYLQITCVPSNDSDPITNASLGAEMPRAVTKISTNSQRARFNLNFNLPRINGSTPKQYKSDDRFQAIMGANPTEEIILHLLHSNAGGAAVGYTFANIVFTQYVEFFDPKPLAQS